MIISNLVGGLGNQLFQYAAGYAFSKRLNAEHYFDATKFNTDYKLHKYSLDHFNITSTRLETTVPNVISLYDRNKGKHRRATDLATITDNKKHYALTGYWLNEKYFIRYRENILQEFSLKTPLSDKSKQLDELITSHLSVSIHVRCNDFLQSKERIGLCTKQYYQEAIASFPPDYWFFVFSDDIPLVQQLYSFPAKNFVYVNHTTADTNYEDLYLMSKCKHNIIANSTFSWWGAWLNRHSGKRVIYPKRWSNNDRNNEFLINNIIPASWKQDKGK